jgi:hypothetical protein
MRNLVLAFALMLVSITAAEAQNRHHRGYHTHHYHKPHHHRPHSNRWVAPLVGGLVLGGVAAGIATHSYSGCPYGTRLRRQEVYDQWGRYLGQRRVCTDY